MKNEPHPSRKKKIGGIRLLFNYCVFHLLIIKPVCVQHCALTRVTVQSPSLSSSGPLGSSCGRSSPWFTCPIPAVVIRKSWTSLPTGDGWTLQRTALVQCKWSPEHIHACTDRLTHTHTQTSTIFAFQNKNLSIRVPCGQICPHKLSNMTDAHLFMTNSSNAWQPFAVYIIYI